MAERTCTSTHHVFDGPDGGGKRLSEGESATCQCGNVASALRDGKIEVTVRAVDLAARIPVSIIPARCPLPGCTFPGEHGHGADR